MNTVRIIALRQDRKRLLEHLQNSALIQIRKCEKSKDGFSKIDVTSQMQIFERNVALTEQALKILDKSVPDKKGLLSAFKGRRVVDPDDIGVYASKAGDVINVCSRITELEKECADNQAEQIRIKTSLEQLKAWENLDIPLNTTDTKSTAIFIGTQPEEYTQERLSQKNAEENPKLEFEFEI